jgi:hypothetical protein
MEKASSWLSKLKIALIISIGVAIVYSILSYLYVDNLVATGVDPLGEESQWDGFLVLIYVAVSFVAIPIAVFLFVSSIGFMFRTAQWLKSMDPGAIEGKPGIIIAAYFVPVADIVLPWRYMSSMNKAGVGTDESKTKLKTLITLNLALAAIAFVVNGNQWADIILGAPEPTLEEIATQEWRGIIGSLFDIGAMTAMYFIVTPLFAGLTKRIQ